MTTTTTTMTHDDDDDDNDDIDALLSTEQYNHSQTKLTPETGGKGLLLMS